MDSTQSQGRVAPQSCLPCKRQKRKCDKTMPNCSLCKRIGRICRYDAAKSPEPVENCGVREAKNPAPLGLFNAECFTPSSIESNILNQASNIVGEDSNILGFTAAYLETVHTWFPVLNRTQVLSLSGPTNPTATSSLLSVCMLLMNISPNNLGLSSETLSIYTFLKGSVGLLDGIGINTLELLQCRLLVTLFEFSHGMYPAAYISIGGASRAASALKMNEMQYRLDEEMEKEAEAVGKGIVVLDRCIALEYAGAPCIIMGIPSHDKLLCEYDMFDSKLSVTLSPTHVRQFTRLYQASHLLNRVLTHVHNPTPHYDFNGSEAMQLMKTLNSLHTVLLEETPKERVIYSGAIAICNCALMTLYVFGFHSKVTDNEDCPSIAYGFLESIVIEVVSMVEKLYGSLLLNNINGLSPFVLHSIYKATMILTQELRDSKKLDRLRSLQLLSLFLQHCSHRWLIAGRYLELLEEAADE